MDRLLRDIQSELLPDREPAPPLPDPSPREFPASHAAVDTGIPAADQQIQALSELATRLVASMRELLAGYERVMAQTPAHPPTRRRRAAPARPDAPDVALAAGPFANLDALREFEHAVSRLPGVREVAVQAYEGTDRAVIEVRLGNP
jgi:hypothetical protein